MPASTHRGGAGCPEELRAKRLLHYGRRKYDVAPDGRFMMLRDEESPEPAQIHIVLNWFQELERLVPTN